MQTLNIIYTIFLILTVFLLLNTDFITNYTNNKEIQTNKKATNQVYLYNQEDKGYSTRTDKLDPNNGYEVILKNQNIFNKSRQLYTETPVQDKDGYIYYEQTINDTTYAMIDDYRGHIYVDEFDAGSPQYYQWKKIDKENGQYWLQKGSLYLCGEQMVGGTPRSFDYNCLWTIEYQE